MKEKLLAAFAKRYGMMEEPVVTYFAPGRVNLIGEHIDYNGGFVFPCALSMGTYMAVRKREDQVVRLASLNMDLAVEINLEDQLVYDKAHEWANYPKGVMAFLIREGCKLQGMDILFSGNIPTGSGLSSSASLEVVTAFGLNDMFNGGNSLLQLVQLSQAVERQFIGVNCGIMDQFVVGFGKDAAAILLNCSTLDYEYVPLNLGAYKIVICNTNKKRELGDSKYNERRGECEAALSQLKNVQNILELCDLTPAQFEDVKHVVMDDVQRKRAEHAVYENDRVKEAVKVLNEDNLVRFGELMNASHESLRDLYEVSCRELDVMVEEARQFAGEKGTLGARMTGAGFGGCTVNIVHEEAVPKFIAQVSENYELRTGLKAEIYVANVSHGAKKL